MVTVFLSKSKKVEPRNFQRSNSMVHLVQVNPTLEGAKTPACPQAELFEIWKRWAVHGLNAERGRFGMLNAEVWRFFFLVFDERLPCFFSRYDIDGKFTIVIHFLIGNIGTTPSNGRFFFHWHGSWSLNLNEYCKISKNRAIFWSRR